MCWKREKTIAVYRYSSLHLESIYLARFIAACHTHCKHSAWNVSFFQACTHGGFKILFSTCAHLLIDLQYGGRTWYTYLRQMKCEISGCVFFCMCKCTHLHIFQKGKKKLSAGSAFDSLQVQRVIYKREYFCKDSHASLSVPVLEILRLFAQMSVLVSDLGRIVISAMTKVTGRSLGVLLLSL